MKSSAVQFGEPVDIYCDPEIHFRSRRMVEAIALTRAIRRPSGAAHMSRNLFEISK
jgi:hypothetical protein